MPQTPEPLRIALDPELKRSRGPELEWAWRLALTALGRPWVEVDLGDECDIAHVARGVPAVPSRFLIRADRDRWGEERPRLLEEVHEWKGWTFLRFRGEAAPSGEPQALDGVVLLNHDVVFDLFWLASGRAEAAWPRNGHGHPEPAPAFLEQRIFPRALASGIAARLDLALGEVGLAPGVPRWPAGKRAAACLTHDVDYPEVVRWLEPARVIARRGRAGTRAALDVALGRRSTWQFDSWVELEDRYAARSAFYFVARKGSLREYATGTPDSFYDIRSKRFRALFRRLQADGVEIGLHSSYRAYQSPDRFAAERSALEEAASVPVVGNRHHYLHLDPDEPEDTLLLHERLGFEYDSTLGHDRYLGWRNSLAFPFFPFHARLRRELETLQVPFAWMDQHLFQYGADNPGDPAHLLEGLIAQTAEHEGCLVVNIHDYTFDNELFPGWSRTYAQLLERLDASGEFWIETPRAVARHWRARANAITRSSHGLTQGGGARDAPLAVGVTLTS